MYNDFLGKNLIQFIKLPGLCLSVILSPGARGVYQVIVFVPGKIIPHFDFCILNSNGGYTKHILSLAYWALYDAQRSRA